MHSHKEGRPRLVAGDARHLTNETPCIYGPSRPRVNCRTSALRGFPFVGLALFALTAGAVLYLVANVVEVRVGWHSVAMLELAGWLLTLVAAADCSRSSR